MIGIRARYLCVFLACAVLLAGKNGYGQNERQIPPPGGPTLDRGPARAAVDEPSPDRSSASPNGSAYDSKFFVQLRSLFGKFRDADLKRAFESAVAVPCSELVDDKGEWRPVAFFNDDRRLGDWYRDNLEEVKSDLAVYIFKGTCRGDRTSVQLTTKFPVLESLDQYNAQQIRFDQIAVNVNSPVSVLFDYPTEAYSFDLPYLFRSGQGANGQNTYSLTPQSMSGRNHYAEDVINHWDCKNVKASDVTYQFLICRTSLLSRDPVGRRTERDDTFGSSAYFILSDGKEASSRVTFSFTDPTVDAGTPAVDPASAPPAPAPAPSTSSVGEDRRDAEPPAPRAAPPSRPGVAAWKTPSPTAKLVNATGDEFRFQFNLQTWLGKISSPQLISDQKMSALAATTKLPATADYCVWRPGAVSGIDRLLAQEPDALVDYSVKSEDKLGPIPASITFDMKTHTGLHLGTLECSFPRAEKASDVGVERWISTVGGHLTLQIPQ